MLIGLAVLAWIISTQLNTAKTISTGDSTVQGTPVQIEQHAKDSVTKAMQQEQRQAEDRAAASQQAQ
jgi:hypothetical protein